MTEGTPRPVPAPVPIRRRRTGWWLAAGAGTGALLALRHARRVRAVPTALRSPVLFVTPSFSPTMTRIVRKLLARAPAPDAPPGVRMSERFVPAEGAVPAVRVVVFERDSTSGVRPALLWMHGGGYVFGMPEQDMTLVARILDRLDVVIVSVDYRLAPDHPFPAPLDDCHAALRWLVDHAAELAVDPRRIAIGGQSAGGGLAAALVQRAVDTGPIVPAFQLLVYPMLDAATTTRADDRGTGAFVWTAKSNRFGWGSYLGGDPGRRDHPAYAVPGQRASLVGLPPAWIGVGTLDLFHEEDVAYARRLTAAGVACDLEVVEGGYHAFLMKADAPASIAFYDSMLSALAVALAPTDAA